ncbi:MAG: hypothetical protein LWW93_02585 [Hyphomicrobiales bacterium]|nr:hypothetical protein [Hyphomicrobiales bacterium]
MGKALFAAVLLVTSATAAFAATSGGRTPAEAVAALFRAKCVAAGGSFSLGEGAIVTSQPVRSETSTDVLVDGPGVLCRGAAGWSVRSGIYSEDARLLVDDLDGMEVVGDARPRVVYTRSGPACHGAKSCKIWMVWNGEKLVAEAIDYGVTKTPPAVRAPVLRPDDTAGGYDHNGSDMTIDFAAGRIVYRKPKASIAGTIEPGQVMFVGRFGTGESAIEGVAFTFKKGCAPAPYHVRGVRVDGWRLRLAGEAPIREANGCAVVGYTRESPNAVLLFERYE